jgi:hypothetical protein
LGNWFHEHYRELGYHLLGIGKSIIGKSDEDECEMTPAERIIDLFNCIHDWMQELNWIIRGIIRSLLGLPAGYHEETTPEKVQKRLEKMRSLKEELQHHNAARTGEGPQPWDQDWYLYQKDFSKDIILLAKKGGWHNIQSLLELFNWALASPQGQRSLGWNQDRGEPDPCNPWQEPLALLLRLYFPLKQASHELLREQAKSLSYSEQSHNDLDERLLSLLKAGQKEKV